jgi:DNA-binding NtrC family response regulator
VLNFGDDLCNISDLVPQSQMSVLIVEDDQAIAELYAMKLRMDGFTVHQAADATTARVIFDRAKPKVVCVDTRLPDVSGVKAAELFIRSGALVILLTNDQESYERPPQGVVRSLLKARTTPGDLSQAIMGLLVAVIRSGGPDQLSGRN